MRTTHPKRTIIVLAASWVLAIALITTIIVVVLDRHIIDDTPPGSGAGRVGWQVGFALGRLAAPTLMALVVVTVVFVAGYLVRRRRG